MTSFFIVSGTLLKRELVRFFRQGNRVAGALGTPLVFWFLMGSGLNPSFKSEGVSYLQYFFPGTVLLILLFTAIFSTISIIEDRREGFLQGVLVAPVSRSAVVMGKCLGGTFLAVLQSLFFFIMAPFLGISFGLGAFFYLLLILTVISFGLTGLGFVLAWRLDSTQGFHAIMNLFLMPLWLLSGALFPMTNVPLWLDVVMSLNPLTYAMSGLHLGFFGSQATQFSMFQSRWMCLFVCFFFAFVMYILCVRTAQKN